MGERKGTNKYYPPDYDPKKGGLNKFMGTHALRERARKLHLGIMIIRFEMPYNIWCEGCNNHIGMGVRYNAEKKKIGMYYSTPVYQFRMKCHLCDNHFEIKTDPANLDYVIESGARRQERRWDPNENGQVVPDDKQVIHKLADDAMFKLQHGVEDQRKLKDVTPTLSKLENLQERWKDDYMANRALRDIFRARKRELQDQQNKDNEFLKKRSLDIPLLQESDDDAKVASLIRLQPALSVDERQKEKRCEIDKKSNFPFPLLAAPLTSTATVSTISKSDLDKDQSQSQRTKSSDPLSGLQQRRLSLGIKLKTETSLLKTHIPTVSNQIADQSLKDNGILSPVAPDAAENLNKTMNNVSNHTQPTDDGVVATFSGKEEMQAATSFPLISKSSKDHGNTSGNSTASSRLISSLVSYSDDSDRNSSTSENEES